MTPDWLLLAAGLLAGAMNALAGGGSFVTLPALIATGVPPVIANATSSLALYPAGAVSAWVYREGLARVARVPMAPMVAVSVVGGLIGSALLLATPAALFVRALPWLLLAATIALAGGRRFASMLHGTARDGAGIGVILPGQFVLGIYGGYFGGAVGIMMMAFWSLTTTADLKQLQGARTMLVTAANTAAVAFFVVMGAIGWGPFLWLAPAAMVGGYLGALLGRRLPPALVRFGTVLLAAGVTVVFFVRAYGS